MDAGAVLLRRGVFLTGGRTRGCKAIGGTVGRRNPTESLRKKIATANFKLKKRSQFGKRRLWHSASVAAVRMMSAIGG